MVTVVRNRTRGLENTAFRLGVVPLHVSFRLGVSMTPRLRVAEHWAFFDNVLVSGPASVKRIMEKH